MLHWLWERHQKLWRRPNAISSGAGGIAPTPAVTFDYFGDDYFNSGYFAKGYFS